MAGADKHQSSSDGTQTPDPVAERQGVVLTQTLNLPHLKAAGAKYGIATSHFYWIGAIPAMVFVGLFMMPFYWGWA